MQDFEFDSLARTVAAGATRRRFLTGAAVLAGALGLGGSGDAKKAKVLICHKPGSKAQKEKYVPEKALNGHLKHGDSEGPCPAGSQCLPVSETEGCVTEESGGDLTLSTTCSSGYGAIAFEVPNDTTFADLATLEAEFQFSEGSCGAGTPRFCVVLKDKSECPCTQFSAGQVACNTANAQGDTGDLTDNSVEWFNLCDPNAPVINTYEDALALYASEEIDYIFLVADTSNGSQTVTVEPCVTLA